MLDSNNFIFFRLFKKKRIVTKFILRSGKLFDHYHFCSKSNNSRLLVYAALVRETISEPSNKPCQRTCIKTTCFLHWSCCSFQHCFFSFFKRNRRNEPDLLDLGKRIHCVHPLLNDEKKVGLLDALTFLSQT